MSESTRIPGIHHITAVASSASENLAFYQYTLGLRLVKKTVNFDDPYTYHLYFGDGGGTPGSILTFFPWENLPRGEPGAGMLTSVAFAVPLESMDYWEERLSGEGSPSIRTERFGEPVIQFRDPHGLSLELVGVSNPPPTQSWSDGPVRPDDALRGFHSATATLNALESEQSLLMDAMGFSLMGEESGRYRFAMADEMAPGHYYDLVVDPTAPRGRPGSGTIHHAAFRALDDEAQSKWIHRLRQNGVQPTSVRDRKYFRSIYFNTPGGVLFEIATDPPGFDVDETLEELGSRLALPVEYESMRETIESRLPPAGAPFYPHLFNATSTDDDKGHTVVTFHGTGGRVHDLLGLAGTIFGSSAILSPRGAVAENGMRRFFRRLANNVFDEADVIARSNELADFIDASMSRYGRDLQNLVACGYSNGANIAAAMLLLRPELFRTLVLLRPMLPLEVQAMPDLSGTRVLILQGATDTIIPPDSTQRLIELLRQSGADLTAHTTLAGHEIVSEDVETAQHWFASLGQVEELSVRLSSMPEKV